MDGLRVRKLNFPVAIISPDFLVTNVTNDGELSDRVAYCSERYEGKDWQLFSRDGEEFRLKTSTVRNTNTLVRIFCGRSLKYDFSFLPLQIMRKEELGDIFVKHLSRNSEWWRNNEEKIDLSAVIGVIENAESIVKMFEELGWFSPEAF